MKSSNMKAALLKRGREPAAVGNVAVLPVAEMPMVLMLEQLRPNPDNPRTTRNPKYEEIKSSIHARGLDSVPKVTKNPDSAEDVYIFSDGGNTATLFCPSCIRKPATNVFAAFSAYSSHGRDV